MSVSLMGVLSLSACFAKSQDSGACELEHFLFSLAWVEAEPPSLVYVVHGAGDPGGS